MVQKDGTLEKWNLDTIVDNFYEKEKEGNN